MGRRSYLIFMYYNSFLVLLSQLAFQEKGKILLDGCEVSVKSSPDSSCWELKTFLSSEHLPLHLKESLLPGRKLFLESERSYLQRSCEGTVFVQIVQKPKKYLEYKRCIKSFFETLSLWMPMQLEI